MLSAVSGEHVSSNAWPVMRSLQATSTDESKGQSCICRGNRSACISLQAFELLHLNNKFLCLT